MVVLLSLDKLPKIPELEKYLSFSPEEIKFLDFVKDRKKHNQEIPAGLIPFAEPGLIALMNSLRRAYIEYPRDEKDKEKRFRHDGSPQESHEISCWLYLKKRNAGHLIQRGALLHDSKENLAVVTHGCFDFGRASKLIGNNNALDTIVNLLTHYETLIDKYCDMNEKTVGDYVGHIAEVVDNAKHDYLLKGIAEEYLKLAQTLVYSATGDCYEEFQALLKGRSYPNYARRMADLDTYGDSALTSFHIKLIDAVHHALTWEKVPEKKKPRIIMKNKTILRVAKQVIKVHPYDALLSSSTRLLTYVALRESFRYLDYLNQSLSRKEFPEFFLKDYKKQEHPKSVLREFRDFVGGVQKVVVDFWKEHGKALYSAYRMQPNLTCS